jgi:antitoxin VapB
METAKLFQNGKSQAVRLPKEFRFKGDRVYIKRVGHAVVLLPSASFWDTLLESLFHFSADYMSEREQLPLQERGDTFS